MSEVTIMFEVDFCIDDCPFCSTSLDNKTWFCSRLLEGAVSWNSMERDSKPLSNCPFRKSPKPLKARN